jgi:hypothetical protein
MPTPIPRATVEARRRIALEHDDIFGNVNVGRRMLTAAAPEAIEAVAGIATARLAAFGWIFPRPHR